MDFSSITKYLPKKLSIVQIVIILAVLAVIIYIVVKHREIKEGLADIASAYSKIPTEGEVPMVESSEQPFAGNEFEGEGSAEITAEDLLPMTPEGVDNFNRQFPLADPSLDSNNFLTAGFNIGINTVGSSNRNANMSIRPDPVIPEVANGPWNQSTITRDTERRPLDIC
jgi:hypothetical protein